MENKNNALKLSLFFSCCNLNDQDSLSKSDPVIKVYKIQKNAVGFIGKTEVVANELNPIFKTCIDVLFEPLLEQKLKIVVFDEDINDGKDHIG